MAWQFGSRMQRMGFGSFCGMMVGRIIGDIKTRFSRPAWRGEGKKKKEKKKKEIKRRERTLQFNLRTAGTMARGHAPRSA